MKKYFNILVFPILAFLAFRYFSNDPRKEIEKLITEAARKASFEGQAQPIEAAFYAKEILNFATEDLHLLGHTDQGDHAVQGIKEIRPGLITARTKLDQLAVHVKDFKIELTSQDKATAQLVIRGMGKEPGRTDYFLEEHPILLKLTKSQGQWLIYYGENSDKLVTK
ncbi:hypothetical protein JNK13_03225 [bacterium]|nr:hypothetical protein [bacterium]